MPSGDTRQDQKRRGPSPSLQVEQILTAALRLLDRDGAKAFNVRSLAAELGAAPMTLYNYFPTKVALVTATVDSVLAQTDLPSASAEQWDEELRRYARQAWETQAAHPWIPTLLAEERLVDRPMVKASRRALLELFSAAGADEETSRQAVAAFFSFMIGSFMQVRLTPGGKVPARAHTLFQAGINILIDGLSVRFSRRA